MAVTAEGGANLSPGPMARVLEDPFKSGMIPAGTSCPGSNVGVDAMTIKALRLKDLAAEFSEVSILICLNLIEGS